MAAIDFITVDRTTSTAIKASKLLECIGAVRRALELCNEVKSIMDHCNNGADFTVVEAKFGLAAGAGSVVYGLVDNVFATPGPAKNLTERVG